MNIAVDRLTNEVKGLNVAPTPLYVTVEVAEDFDLTKTVTTINYENPLVHKEDEQGRKLYKDNVSEDGLVFDEVHYEDGKKPVKFEEKEVTNKWTEEDGQEYTEIVIVQVPVEFEELEPVMVDNYTTQTVSIKTHPQEFTLEEVLQEKYTKVLESSQKDYILADMFLNEDDIDLEDENHSANTGASILELLPQGQAKTKTIALQAQATEFELLEFKCPDGVEVYLSGKKFVNGKLTLTSPVSNCTIKFVNTTDKKITVNSYAIGY